MYENNESGGWYDVVREVDDVSSARIHYPNRASLPVRVFGSVEEVVSAVSIHHLTDWEITLQVVDVDTLMVCAEFTYKDSQDDTWVRK